MRGANSLERFETVHSGHHDVEQDGVELFFSNELQRRDTIIGFHDLEAAASEKAIEYGAVLRDVIDDKEPNLVGICIAHSRLI